MLMFTKNRSAEKSVIGLDFNGNQIHAVEAALDKTTIKLLNAKTCQLDNNVFANGMVQDPKKIESKLQNLLNNWHSKNVAITINSELLNTRIFNIESDLNDEDLEETIILEAESILHYPIDAAYFDYYVLGPNKNNADLNDVCFVACQRKLADSRINVLESLGFNVSLVTTQSCALANLMMKELGNPPSQQTSVLINISSNHAEILVISEQIIIFNDNIESQLSQTFTVIESLIDLAHTSIENLQIDHLFLCGLIDQDNATLANLKDVLGIDISVLTPFKHWMIADDIQMQKNTACAYSLAAGIALESVSR